MKEKYLKIIAGLSVLALILVSIFYFQNNNTYMFFASITANIIQIIMFLVWYFQENPVPERTINQIDEIHKVTKEREEKYKQKEKIITRLIKEGVIIDYDLKKIFQTLRNKEVFLVHSYGEGVPQNLLKSYNGGTQPLISILMKVGFVRVFRQHNLFIVFKKNLPRNLRRLDKLEKFLQQELEKLWEKIEEYAKQKYPSSKYKMYNKWRTKEGLKCSYLLFKAGEEDFVIGYKNRYSFTPQFVTSIIREIEVSKIKPITDKVKLQQFVAKTSIEILLEDFPANIKKELLKHEKTLKEEFKIKNFTDLKDIPVESLKNKISELSSVEEDWSIYSEKIKLHAQEFYNILVELGMSK